MNDLADLPEGWNFGYQARPNNTVSIHAENGRRNVQSALIGLDLDPENFRRQVMLECEHLAKAVRNREANVKTVHLLFENKES